MRTVILYIAVRCNQHCVFCLEEDGGWQPFKDPSTLEVTDELNRLYARGARQITFMGGETFFRKDLPHIIGHAKSLGFSRIGVTTNGTVLSKPGFIRNLVDAGLDMIELSIHGHTEELTEMVTGTTFSHKRQASALEEINEYGKLPVVLNLVVCRENKEHVKSVIKYILEKLPDAPLRFKIKFVSLIGMAKENQEASSQALRLEEVDAIDIGDYLESQGAKFWYGNMPLCRLGRHAGHSLELMALATDETYYDYDHRGDEGYFDSGRQFGGRVWPEESCGACTLRPICPGMEETYRLVNGSDALSTMTSDPLSFLRFSLGDNNDDPAKAEARLEALSKEPRPSKAIIHRTEPNLVQLRHPEEPEPLQVKVEEKKPGKRAFCETQRFTLSYFRWENEDPGLRPLVSQQLDVSRMALEAADSGGASLNEAVASVSAATAPGWTSDYSPKEEPKPAVKVIPLGLSRLRS